MNVLDLFSGIGGLALGLERAGMRTVAFCEQDLFCRHVLEKHWPAIPIYSDIRTLTADRLASDGIGVDAIAGGFPCQDVSRAGYGGGLAGERSGLWREYARLIGELRPRYVIVENVAALLDPGRGMDAVCGDLAGLGYDAEWSLVSACAVGAPHMRQRVFIVAYPNGKHGRPRLRHPAARPYRPLYKKSTVSRVQELVFEHGWRIHPNFTEALMGFPTGWSEIEPSETPSRQRSRKSSDGQS